VEEHPTGTELEGYANGVVSAGDLLRIDDHLAVCAPCRRRAATVLSASRRLASAVSAIQHELAPPAVSVFARPATWAALAAAAMLIIVADIVWGTRTAVPEPSRAQVARVSVDQLSAAEHAAVDAAVQSGQLRRAPVLTQLTSRAGVLMGSQAHVSAFGPTFPVGVVVDAERPTLEWSPADEATAYRVAVFDESFNMVATSGWQQETRWTPDRALPRGRSYVWQVTARIGAREVVAPAPPQPESRFKVTSVEQSAQLAEVRTRAGDSHLALAVLLAEAGVLDEAERELTLARTANPESSAVKQLQLSLSALRR
jgi:hypothetical protein